MCTGRREQKKGVERERERCEAQSVEFGEKRKKRWKEKERKKWVARRGKTARSGELGRKACLESKLHDSRKVG